MAKVGFYLNLERFELKHGNPDFTTVLERLREAFKNDDAVSRLIESILSNENVKVIVSQNVFLPIAILEVNKEGFPIMKNADFGLINKAESSTAILVSLQYDED